MINNLHTGPRVYMSAAESADEPKASAAGAEPKPPAAARDTEPVKALNAKPVATETDEATAFWANLDPELAKELGGMEALENEFKFGDEKPENRMIIAEPNHSALAPLVNHFLDGLTPAEKESVYALIPLEEIEKGALETALWSVTDYHAGAKVEDITVSSLETLVNRAASLGKKITVEQYIAYERAAATAFNKQPSDFKYEHGKESAPREVRSVASTFERLGIKLNEQGLVQGSGLDVVTELMETQEIGRFRKDGNFIFQKTS